MPGSATSAPAAERSPSTSRPWRRHWARARMPNANGGAEAASRCPRSSTTGTTGTTAAPCTTAATVPERPSGDRGPVTAAAREFDHVVVGLGGIGSAAAYWLARRGDGGRSRSVLGLEQFDIGHPNGASEDHSRIIRRSYHT